MDWMKVEKGTPWKWQMRHVARACGCSLGDAFLAWFALWAWFDGMTADGNVPKFTAADCDAQGALKGLGQALVEVKWLEFHEDGCLVLGWDEHNGSSAKKRALTARRVGQHRKRTGTDTGFRPWRQGGV